MTPVALGVAWRSVLLAALAVGLASSPAARMPATLGRGALAVCLAGGLAVVAARPRVRGATGRDAGARRATSISLVAAGAWLGALAVCCGTAGLAIGAMRLAAIDAGAYQGSPGRQVALRGFVTAVPRRSEGEVQVRVETASGRLLLVAPEPVGELPVGREVRARGTLRAPQGWESGYLERLGIATIAETGGVTLTGRRRGGLEALADRVRERAEAALESGTPPAQAALLRGFVLGEDDRIDPETVRDFQRSGLAHLLAVSGQNVLLLALLATPILALLGTSLRTRLVCVLLLIAVYVPVAGAGPSIQRAGVMGAAGIVAALASRPASRWHAMLLAATLTLALDPQAAADAGWQLSFAAVGGIAVWAAGLREVFIGPTGGKRHPRATLADGAAVTLAATLATAPLMAHHFEAVSLASLPANLLALPAVAPVMWLGMLAAGIAQVGVSPEPVTGLAGLLAAYIEQVAHWLAAPEWAQFDVSLTGAPALAAVYVGLLATLGLAIRHARRRRGLGRPLGRLRPALAAAVVLIGLGAVLAFDPLAGGHGEQSREPGSLRATVLDVGQGDAILLEPPGGEPILIDGGPPGEEIAEKLRALGVSGLGAAVVTHDELDHAGGIDELLGQLTIDRLAYARAGADLLREARAAGADPRRLFRGATIESGKLRLEVLWPPRELLGTRPEDPNDLALVMLARCNGFRMLLTGDAEAETAPLDPGPIDVLKVAHHGSADAGLDTLLDRAQPRLAVVSVGEDNPYGHPAPETLAELAEHAVHVLRTDSEGEITILAGERGWSVPGGG